MKQTIHNLLTDTTQNVKSNVTVNTNSRAAQIKRVFIKISIYALSLGFLPVMAARYHVNVNNGADTNNGLTWSAAFETFQAALDKAQANDTIWIASGIYTPTKKYAEKYTDDTPTSERAISFIIPDGVIVLGGFPANPSDATGLSARDWKANETILSGDVNGDDDYGFRTENAYHVIIMFDATPQTVLDGFTITGGYNDAPKSVHYNDRRAYAITYGDGSAIYSFSSVTIASPTLRNLFIYDNFASNEGAGLFNYAPNDDASPEITNVEFSINRVENKKTNGGRGGGLFIEGTTTTAKLTNVIITGNTALSAGASYGGGAYFKTVNDCTPIIQNTLVAGNISNGGAGLFFNSRTNNTYPTLINVTISGNKAYAIDYSEEGVEYGGGMTVLANLGEANPIIQNTVICDNEGDIQNELLVKGIKGSNPTFSHSFVKGMDLGGTNLPGNTSTASMFANPGNAADAPFWDGYRRHIYQLLPESPLVNKGNNAYLSLSKDLAGDNRVYGGTIDIGAYESQGGIPSNNDNIIAEKSIWAVAGTLYVNIDTQSTLRIYSMSGLLIKHIDNLTAGSYEFALAKGLYIVTLSNGVTEKVVIR